MIKKLLLPLLGLLFVFQVQKGYSQTIPNLDIADSSFPNPMTLCVGNVSEFVYVISNTGQPLSELNSIFFHCNANPGISYFPLGHPIFYLTGVDSTLENYFTIYSYPNHTHYYSAPL